MGGAGDLSSAVDGTAGGPVGVLRAALDALPDAVLLADADGVIHWANRRFTDLFRHTPSAVRDRGVGLVCGPFAQQAEGRAVEKLVREGAGQVETIAFTQEGQAFPCLVRVRVVSGWDLRVVGISEQTEVQRLRAELVVKAEAAARERETLRVACEGLIEPVLVADDADRLLVANREARALFGLGVEHAGRSVGELPLPPAMRGLWLTFLGSNEAVAERTVLLPAGDARAAHVLAFARIRSPFGAPLASVAVVRAAHGGPLAAARRNLLLRLVPALRAPLAVLNGGAGRLVRSPGADTEAALATQAAAARAGSVIEELAELAQFDAEESALAPRRTDLAALAREVVEECAAQHREIAIRLVSAEGPVHVHADPPHLRRALLRLVTALARRGSPVEVVVSVADAGAGVAVRDHGPAPRADELMRLFEPFAPASSAPGGLALVQRIVEAHGGAVHAEAPAEGGVRVAVELP